MKKWIIIKLTSLFMALFVLVGILYALMYNNFFNGYNHNGIFQTPYTDSNDCSSGSIFANNDFNFSYYNYDDPYYNANPDEPYIVGDASVDSGNIKEIYIDWTVGDIDIVETDDTAISIKEKCFAKSDDNKLRYRVVDNTLEIRYINRGVSFAGNGKKLILGLPESKKGEFEVVTNSTKCNINVHNVTLSDLTATTVHGDLTVNNSKIYNLYYYAQEGNIYTNCSSNGISVILGQGTADCTFDNYCKDITLNVVDNGKITVRLPEDIPGYLARIDFSKMNEGSVGFGSDFNDKEENGDYSHTRTYGDESLNIYAEISEGSFDIKKR